MTSWSSWPLFNKKVREHVIKTTKAGVAQILDYSPEQNDFNPANPEELIDVLFPNNPLLCCGTSSWDSATKTREEFRDEIIDLRFIVPSPMTLKTGISERGAESARTLSNTGPRRYLVIAQNKGSLDDQAAVLWYLALNFGPLVLVVHANENQLEGWFFCDGQSDDLVRSLMQQAVLLGADYRTWQRCEFVTQPCYNLNPPIYFNPEVIV